MVSTKLKELRDNNEAHTVVYMPRFNTARGLDDYFMKCYGTPNTFSYADGCFASANELGLGSIFTGGKEARSGNTAVMGDYENAKLAVLISRNPAGCLVAFTLGAAYDRGRKNGLNCIGGGGADMATALTKMEMILCISPYWNETRMYADVIDEDICVGCQACKRCLSFSCNLFW